MDKAALRKTILELRSKISEEERLELSRKIAANLFKLDVFNKPANVFCYLSTNLEVDTSLMIETLFEKSFSVFVPRICKDEMYAVKIDTKTTYEKNKFGILEPQGGQPIEKEEVDICILPGLTFTLSGKRLGYGKGFYDTYLRGLNCIKIGVCFNSLLSDDIFTNEFDVDVNYMITDKKIYYC